MTSEKEDRNDHREDLKLGFAEEWKDSGKINVASAKGKYRMEPEAKARTQRSPLRFQSPACEQPTRFPTLGQKKVLYRPGGRDLPLVRR